MAYKLCIVDVAHLVRVGICSHRVGYWGRKLLIIQEGVIEAIRKRGESCYAHVRGDGSAHGSLQLVSPNVIEAFGSDGARAPAIAELR
jgi:hypothetical protein